MTTNQGEEPRSSHGGSRFVLRVAGREIACMRGGGPAGLSAAQPALFLVHAAGGAARNLGSLLRRLGDRAVALDLPGHGRSPGEAPRTIEESAEILAAVAEALAPAPARIALGGHSMGAAVAAAAAASLGRSRVAALLAIAAGARLAFSAEFAAAARRSFDSFLATLAALQSPPAYVAQLRETGTETVARDLEAAAGYDVLAPARAYGGPLLVLAGGRDRTATPESARALAEGTRGGELVVVPDAGHVLPVERPNECAEAILRFLARLA